MILSKSRWGQRPFMVAVVALAGVLLIASEVYAETQFDFSGMIRIRPEGKDNADFNDSKDDETAFIGSRTRLTVKATKNADTFAKITIQDVRRWGEANNVSTSKEQQSLDIFEGYFQVNNIMGDILSVKIGRQTLVYGDQRLLGSLGWVDQARTHDAAKVMLKFGSTQVDFIASKEAESGKPTASDADDDILGIYSVSKIGDGITFDVYVLNWKTAGTTTNDVGDSIAIDGKDINTYGVRVAVKKGSFDATGEVATQDGDWNATTTQSATSYAVKAGFKLNVLGGTRIGVEYDHGDGDDNQSDNEHGTFVFPFHTNHGHYGYMDFFSWGNMNDIQVNIASKPVKGVMVKLAYHTFTLDSATGDWLNVVGTKVFLAGDSSYTETDAGAEVDLTLVYKAGPAKVVGGYSVFTPGDAVKERNGGKSDNSTWSYVMGIYTF